MRLEHMIVILLSFVAFVLSGLVCLLGYILHIESMLFSPDMLTKFSVPCNDISLSADEDAENLEHKDRGLDISIDSRGQYICSEKNLSLLFSLVFERQSRLRVANGRGGTQYISCGNEQLRSKPGHMSVALSKPSKHRNISDDESNVIIYWDKYDRQSYVDQSAEYKNGKITITEGRTYFVYVSVHFNISRQEEEHDKYHRRSERFSVRICKNINGYEQTILGRTQLFNTTSDNAVSSLRIGGHLSMSRNDVLYIKVSNANRLISNSKGNNFGLFPI